MDYLLGGQGDVPGTMETGSTDLSLTSRQCLLYVKLLLEKVSRVSEKPLLLRVRQK